MLTKRAEHDISQNVVCNYRAVAKLHPIYITVNYSGQQLPIKRTRDFLKALLCNAFKKSFVTADVTWNSDNEPLAASITGQPRGDCPYL